MDNKTPQNADRIYLLDRFSVPKDALEIFIGRMNANRNFIKQLPGFIRQEAFKREDENGSRTVTVVTIALWQNEAFFQEAKHAVQKEYERTSFELSNFMEHLGIQMERQVCIAID